MRCRDPRRTHGVILIYVMFALIALSAVVVWAVDWGRATLAKTEMQRAVDAAEVDFNSLNHLYGRVIGKTLKVNSNARIHVDESLPAVASGSAPAGGGSVTVSMVE